MAECNFKKDCNGLNCGEFCLRKKVMDSLYAKALIPKKYVKDIELKYTKTDEPSFKRLEEIEKNIVQFIDDGECAYIYSTICGNGKTTSATKLLKAYFNEKWHNSGFNCRGLYIHVPQLIQRYKTAISKSDDGLHDLMYQVRSVPIVIWDDLPVAKLTDFEQQFILDSLEYRLNEGRTNIYTGNCNRETCSNTIGERLTSRIYGAEYIIELREQDKRGR